MNGYYFLLGYLCCLINFEFIILFNRYKKRKGN